LTGTVLNEINTASGKYISLGGLEFLVLKNLIDETVTLSPEFKSGSSQTSDISVDYTATVWSRTASVRITATFAQGTVEANIGGGTTTGQLTSGTQFTTATNLGLSYGANILNVIHSLDGSYKFTLTRPSQVISAITVHEVGPSYTHSIADWTQEKAMGSFTYDNTDNWVYTGGTVTHSCTSLKVTATWSGSHTVTTTLDSLTTLTLSSGVAKTDGTHLAVAEGSRNLRIDHSNDGRVEIAFAKPSGAKLTALTIVEVGPSYATEVSDWTLNTLLSSVSSGTYKYTLTQAKYAATSLKITATWSDGETVKARRDTNTEVTLTLCLSSSRLKSLQYLYLVSL
jgi:hypothetical protein